DQCPFGPGFRGELLGALPLGCWCRQIFKVSPTRALQPIEWSPLRSPSPQFNLGKRFKRVSLRRRLEKVPCPKIFSLRILRDSNALGSFREIVGRMSKLNLGSKQQPIGAWFPKRHSHAAGIQNANSSDHPV